jgi:hypothetical protein
MNFVPDEEKNNFTSYTHRMNIYYKEFGDHRKYSIFYPYERILSIYTIILILVGTCCNLTSFVVMLGKNIRKYSCMRYLAILSLVDVIVLYQWNLNSFYKYFLTKPPHFIDLDELSVFWCRWISYFAFSSLQMSSWLLALVSLDRVMIFYSRWWKKNMTEPKRVNLIILFLFVVIFGLNSHILFLNGYKLVSSTQFNETQASNPTQLKFDNKLASKERIICYQTKSDKQYIFPKWERVHLLVYNAIPFTIMLVCNSLIIYNVKFANKIQSKNQNSMKKKRRMTFMLILVTFSFMCLTLPSVIVHTFFREHLKTKSYRRLVNLVVNNLLHTSHGINFFLYVFSAPNFRAELRKVVVMGLGCCKLNQPVSLQDTTGRSKYFSTKNAVSTTIQRNKKVKIDDNESEEQCVNASSSLLEKNNTNVELKLMS